MDVEVAHQKIAGNCSPSLAANTGSSTLESRGKQRGGHREGRQDGGRQAAASRGNGKRSRRSNKARKTGESKVASCEFGVSRLLDAQRCTVNCCECPVRANGDTSVASQQSAAPLAVAPCTTMSRHRRSPDRTLRAVVWACREVAFCHQSEAKHFLVGGCSVIPHRGCWTARLRFCYEGLTAENVTRPEMSKTCEARVACVFFVKPFSGWQLAVRSKSILAQKP